MASWSKSIVYQGTWIIWCLSTAKMKLAETSLTGIRVDRATQKGGADECESIASGLKGGVETAILVGTPQAWSQRSW
ncbi:hypothetical protein WJX82_009016 [Trebouxia sp. C0006]